MMNNKDILVIGGAVLGFCALKACNRKKPNIGRAFHKNWERQRKKQYNTTATAAKELYKNERMFVINNNILVMDKKVYYQADKRLTAEIIEGNTLTFFLKCLKESRIDNDKICLVKIFTEDDLYPYEMYDNPEKYGIIRKLVPIYRSSNIKALTDKAGKKLTNNINEFLKYYEDVKLYNIGAPVYYAKIILRISNSYDFERYNGSLQEQTLIEDMKDNFKKRLQERADYILTYNHYKNIL